MKQSCKVGIPNKILMITFKHPSPGGGVLVMAGPEVGGRGGNLSEGNYPHSGSGLQ